MKYNRNSYEFYLFDEPKPKRVIRRTQKKIHQRKHIPLAPSVQPKTIEIDGPKEEPYKNAKENNNLKDIGTFLESLQSLKKVLLEKYIIVETPVKDSHATPELSVLDSIKWMESKDMLSQGPENEDIVDVKEDIQETLPKLPKVRKPGKTTNKSNKIMKRKEDIQETLKTTENKNEKKPKNAISKPKLPKVRNPGKTTIKPNKIMKRILSQRNSLGISTKPGMNVGASAIINSLYEENPSEFHGPKLSSERLNIAMMTSNSFIGKISKMSLTERISRVWTDLVEKHQEFSVKASNPEEDRQVRKILKERYINNVQRVLLSSVHRTDRGSELLKSKSVKFNAMSAQAKKASLGIGNKTSPKKLSIVKTCLEDLSEMERTRSHKKLEPNQIPLITRQDCDPKAMHEEFVRREMDALGKSLLTVDVERMSRMILSKEVPLKKEDLGLFHKYESDPEHFNVLILSLDEKLSEFEYDDLIPVLQHNFEYIKRELNTDAMFRRSLEFTAKQQDLQKDGPEPGGSDFSLDTYLQNGTIINAAYLAQRRAIWADYIATQPMTPTELLLAEVRTQKQKAGAAIRAEERKQQKQHKREIRNARRALNALFRTPRQTHRLRQAIQEMQDELEGGKSSPRLTPRCSRCGIPCSH